jgi:hypothetical protein
LLVSTALASTKGQVDVHFASGSTEISPEDQAALKKLAADAVCNMLILNLKPQLRFLVGNVADRGGVQSR